VLLHTSQDVFEVIVILAIVHVWKSVSAPFLWGVSVGQRQETPLSHWTYDVIRGNGCALCLSPLWTWLFKDRLDGSLSHELISTHSLFHSHFNVTVIGTETKVTVYCHQVSFTRDFVSFFLWHTNTFSYFKKKKSLKVQRN